MSITISESIINIHTQTQLQPLLLILLLLYICSSSQRCSLLRVTYHRDGGKNY